VKKLVDLLLKNGREKSVLLHHPWIFASAISEITGNVTSGDVIRVVSSNGKPLGLASYSEKSQIRGRILTWNPIEDINKDFYKYRLINSIKKRDFVRNGDCNSYRLVYGESDSLPGLIIDQYDETIVFQLLTAGMDREQKIICELIEEIFPDFNIFERSDADVRALEGLPNRVELIKGGIDSSEIWIKEYDLQYKVDIVSGQKTGFYLDQRENRKKLSLYCQGKKVLNCFSYTGGFTLNALMGGAESVLSIDSSQQALDMMASNIEKNQIDASKSRNICGDVFVELRKLRDRAEKFDVIILDPPKFAPTISQVDKAARGYKDINLLAIKLLEKGGALFTFSCSGGISRDLFQKIVAGAALDANCDLQIIDQLSQAGDHPILTSFPESMYLKGLICIK
jgi:23S rRNA (cytosine1962-C5)-methyltransferase